MPFDQIKVDPASLNRWAVVIVFAVDVFSLAAGSSIRNKLCRPSYNLLVLVQTASTTTAKQDASLQAPACNACETASLDSVQALPHHDAVS